MAAEQTESRREFKPGDIVKHFKREFLKGEMFRTSSKYLYKIIGIAEHTETKEKVVVYQALYKSEKDNVNFGLYVRPYDMFMSCLLYTSPSPRDSERSRMPSSA